MLTEWFELSIFSWFEVIVRACFALIFGFVIGWDRNRKDKPVDSRVYMIVCLTTCMIVIMSQELLYDFPSSENFAGLDLGKVISGTLTGIGFLGAGSIIRTQNNKVVGTATGASIWASGGIGMTLGFGHYGLALIIFISIVGILVSGGLSRSKKS